MLLPILATAAVVAAALVGIVFGRSVRRSSHSGDLGVVSDAWINEHRAPRYDAHR
jgi:hypothetical protein